MKYFLVTFHETDGNDTSVFDAIAIAEDEDAAYGKIADKIAAGLDEAGSAYSEDGDFGFYFDCSEDCPEECDGHGGIVMRSAEAFETLDAARAEQAKTYYHSHWTEVV